VFRTAATIKVIGSNFGRGLTQDTSTSVACSFPSEQPCSCKLAASGLEVIHQKSTGAGCSELKLQANEVEVSGVKPKGGGTTGARGALAPLKFVEGGLSPPYVMAL